MNAGTSFLSLNAGVICLSIMAVYSRRLWWVEHNTCGGEFIKELMETS
jgi:hypothetical protein